MEEEEEEGEGVAPKKTMVVMVVVRVVVDIGNECDFFVNECVESLFSKSAFTFFARRRNHHTLKPKRSSLE